MLRTLAVLSVFVPTLASGQHPLDDLEQGHWVELSLNSMHDVDPCPARDCAWSQVSGVQAEMQVWCGAAFASGFGTLGSFIFHCGGHGGYAGSELYAFDVETRLWSRLTDPFPGGVGDCDADEGNYPDGSPCPQHTYDYVDYHPGMNRFVLLSSQTLDGGGYYSPYAYMYDFDTLEWIQSTRRDVGAGFTGASSAYDPNRGIFWTQQAYNQPLIGFDPEANGGLGTWAAHATLNISIDAVAAIDPIRDLYVILETRSNQEVLVYDLTNPNVDAVTVTVSGDTAPLNFPKPGFEWDPIEEKFVCWTEGTSVYTFEPPSGDWRTEAWHWSVVPAAAGNTVTPAAPNSNGTYSKWRYVPARGVYILATTTSDPIYAYRLSAPDDVAPAAPTGLTVQ